MKRHSKNAIIINFGSTKNKGSEGLLYGQKRILEFNGIKLNKVACFSFDLSDKNLRCIEQPAINYMSWVGKIKPIAILYFIFNVVRFPLLVARIYIWKTTAFIYSTPKTTILPKRLKCIVEANLIVNTGGDTLTSDYGNIGLLVHLANLYIVQLLGKPTIILGETIGPFNNFFVKLIALKILKKCEQIYLREPQSYNYLIDLGLKDKKLKKIYDPAFTIRRDKNALSKIEKVEKIDMSGKGLKVAIFPSQIIHLYSQKLSRDDINKIFSTYIAWLKKELQAKIYIVPHVLGPGRENDDRIAARNIYNNLSEKSDVFLLSKEHSYMTLKGFINRTDLVVSCRMHPMISTVSQSIPVIAIAYSIKTYGVIGKLMGLEKLIIDIKHLSVKSLKDKTRMAINDRDTYKSQLEKKNIELSNHIRERTKSLANLL